MEGAPLINRGKLKYKNYCAKGIIKLVMNAMNLAMKTSSATRPADERFLTVAHLWVTVFPDLIYISSWNIYNKSYYR